MAPHQFLLPINLKKSKKLWKFGFFYLWTLFGLQKMFWPFFNFPGLQTSWILEIIQIWIILKQFCYSNNFCLKFGKADQCALWVQSMGKKFKPPNIFFSKKDFMSFFLHNSNPFRITFISSWSISFLQYYCHSFRIIVIPSKSLPFQIFVILNSSCTFPYPKGEEIGRAACRPYLRVCSKGGENVYLTEHRIHLFTQPFTWFSTLK